MAEWYRGCSRCRHNQRNAQRKNGIPDGFWERFLWSETKQGLVRLPSRFEKVRRQGWSETEGAVKTSRLVYGALSMSEPEESLCSLMWVNNGAFDVGVFVIYVYCVGRGSSK